MAATRLIYFANVVSLIAAQGPLIPDSTCQDASIADTVSVLANYQQALDYCTARFPPSAGIITVTGFPDSIVLTTTTTDTTVLGVDALTITAIVTTDTITVTGLAATVTETSTATTTATSTIVAIPRDLPAARSALQRRKRRQKPSDGPSYIGSSTDATASYRSNPSRSMRYSPNPGHSSAVKYGTAHYYSASSSDRIPTFTSYTTIDTSSNNVPTPTPDPNAAAVLAALRSLDAAVIDSVCSCIGDPSAAVTTTVTPGLTLTNTITATVTTPIAADTVTITESVTAIATNSVAGSIITTATTTTTALVSCQTSTGADILTNGGFDAAGWDDLYAPGWRTEGSGFGVSFFTGDDRFVPVSPPVFAGFPADLSGLDMRLQQDLTNIDTTQAYTVSFYYWPLYINTAPFDDSAIGSCHFDVTWGAVTVANLSFNKSNGSSGGFSQYTYPNIIQPSPTARLDLHYYCDRQWFGDGYAASYLDSVAVVPSRVLCIA